ncbi:potassium-transporting ATPase subunit KdpA [Halovibrio salipaludis]|uniref:Potassium-transporting ATPase potassium-binding subunit n=1 Tax=Halovibrio salipaludis TaxID=2032626 RepID=A0A2A2FBN3_9GAMM|nr:potassium-transporting ATPase subunit KdpA [Halovibrio salipaludis]PAU82022.1 potassium-transporting ATPase subunit KdpA [Halovibrio salipaludis]
MNEVIIIYALTLLLAWPLGRYIAGVYSGETGMGGRVFLPVENGLYSLCGIDPGQPMTWQGYGRALLKFHLMLGLLIFGLLMAQGLLFLNPDGIGGMSWDLSLHTAVSFLTNTNQQHYSGQASLSYLAHTFGIVTLQVVTPAAGMATLFAILRTIFGGRDARTGGSPEARVSVGNFYQDLTRAIVRVMLPLAAVAALLLASQGVPSTYEGAQTVQPLDSNVAMEQQEIPVGPVAPMVAIKQLGTNGGGWYGANSAVPLENPTPLSNLVETVSIVLIPAALVFALGFFTGRRRLAQVVMGVMVVMSVGLASVAIWQENMPNAAFSSLAAEGPNLEGKEVRFGATATALWGSWTTQTSNGSVNGMHDSFNPIGGMVPIMDMFINVIFGGVGVGLIGFLLFLLLAAFLGSLMIGRAPEIAGKPLETREIKLVCIALLLQPLLILGFSAVTLAFPGLTGNSNPGYHGISQVIYEYTSAFANNGSGFEGLNDNSIWWNITCAVNLILGRFIPMLAPLAIAASLASKRTAPEGRGSLSLDTGTFGLMTLAVIVMFTLLSFMPVLILGPIAEAMATIH